jgi:hypothetical protein
MFDVLLVAALGLIGQTSPSPALQTLSVPAERLPDGCALAPAAADRLRVGLSQNVTIDANPWTGTSRQVIAAMRERMEGSPTVPDGPPLDRRASALYLLHLADDVDEGYAAFYVQSGAPDVVVYALKFVPGIKPPTSMKAHPSATVRIALGPVVAMVFGDGGRCFEAVAAYVTSLAK